MKRVLIIWILLLILPLAQSIAPSESQIRDILKELAIPEETLPSSWVTVITQVVEDGGLIKLYQILSSNTTEVDITYMVVYDPESELYNEINIDIASEARTPELQPSYFDVTLKEIELESGDRITAKLQRVKKDDPNIQFYVMRVIRMFSHYKDYTFIVHADSWVYLESAGEPDEIIEGIFKAGMNHAVKYDLTPAPVVEEIKQNLTTSQQGQEVQNLTSMPPVEETEQVSKGPPEEVVEKPIITGTSPPETKLPEQKPPALSKGSMPSKVFVFIGASLIIFIALSSYWLLSKRRELEELDRIISPGELGAEEIEWGTDAMKSEVDELRARIKRQETRLLRAGSEKRALEDEIKVLKDNLKERDGEARGLQIEMDTLKEAMDKSIEEREAELSLLTEKCSTLESSIKDLEERVIPLALQTVNKNIKTLSIEERAAKGFIDKLSEQKGVDKKLRSTKREKFREKVDEIAKRLREMEDLKRELENR